MKKTYIGYSVLAAVLALSAQQANAQQGFGTDKPSKASVVEMTSGSKGLLIPRVALTSLDSFAPVSGEAPTDVDKTDALLVYNTATSDAAVADEEKVTPGYYYWTTDGTSGKWNRLASDADIPTEPWRIQNTTTEATDNADNIYQQGKVAVVCIVGGFSRSEEHTSELQSRPHLVCRLLLEKKKPTLDFFMAMSLR